MPNVASLLKSEITRLARKETRAESEKMKSLLVRQRHEITALKNRVIALEKLVNSLPKPGSKALAVEPGGEGKQSRFQAKGFAKHRKRLGLSAAEAGRLLGVSPQTIYLWESAKTKPRATQQPAIIAFRKLGKRALIAMIEASKNEK